MLSIQAVFAISVPQFDSIFPVSDAENHKKSTGRNAVRAWQMLEGTMKDRRWMTWVLNETKGPAAAFPWKQLLQNPGRKAGHGIGRTEQLADED